MLCNEIAEHLFFWLGSSEEVEKLSIEYKAQNNRYNIFETEIIVLIANKFVAGEFAFVFNNLCFPYPADQNAQYESAQWHYNTFRDQIIEIKPAVIPHGVTCTAYLLTQ